MKSIGFVKDVELLASEDMPVGYTCQEGTANKAQVLNFTFHWKEEARRNAKSPNCRTSFCMASSRWRKQENESGLDAGYIYNDGCLCPGYEFLQ